MGVIVECDKCGHREEIRTLVQVWPVNMHPVSPGNSKDNDRMLCAVCFRNYEQVKASLEVEVTNKLLTWIDHEA